MSNLSSSSTASVKQVLEITIRGRVQGVFFRKHTHAMASGLGLVGTVQNMADGSVYAVAVGTESQLDAFSRWCSEVGSPKSKIESVNQCRHSLEAAPPGLLPKVLWTGFSIVR